MQFSARDWCSKQCLSSSWEKENILKKYFHRKRPECLGGQAEHDSVAWTDSK